MRTVARFQAFLEEQSDDAWDNARSIIEKWYSGKFEEEDGTVRIRKTGIVAKVKKSERELDSNKSFSIHTIEPSHGNFVGLRADLLKKEEKFYIQVDLAVENPRGYIGQPKVPVQAPAFFKDLLSKPFQWRVREDGEHIINKVFPVKDEEDVDQLVKLLYSSKRHLPLFLVSTHEDDEIVVNLSDRLQFVTKGIAHICKITPESSWELSRQLGKEWSCYNGAVRLYWPLIWDGDTPYRHRIWLPPYFTRFDLKEKDSDWKAAKAVAKIVIDHSSFSPRFREITKFNRDSDARKFEDERKRASDSKDFERLATSYAKDNDELRKKIAELETYNENCIAQLNSYRQNNYIEENQLEESIFSSIFDAINYAKSISGDYLIFPDEVDNQISSIAEAEMISEKIVHHLEGLHRLANELRKSDGALGTTIVDWLNTKGYNCSGESKTKRNFGLYTFKSGGKTMEFEKHLKVTDGTSPDRCVRIYFEPTSDNHAINIGMIGSKKMLN